MPAFKMAFMRIRGQLHKFRAFVPVVRKMINMELSKIFDTEIRLQVGFSEIIFVGIFETIE